MEEDVITLLGSLGYPASWGGLGQGTALPRLALYNIAGADDVTLDGRSGWLDGRIQVDCYAATYAEAIGVAREVRGALSGYTGGSIWSARLDATRDMTDEAGGETIQRISLSFSVQYTG